MSHISHAVRPNFHGRTVEPITPKKTISLLNKTSYPSKILHCDVVFGSPAMECNGTGICKITGTNTLQRISSKKSCQLTFGQIAVATNGKISLFFFREFLCIQLYRLHFRKGILAMKEACPLPAEIAKGLNINGEALLPGNYSVVECDGYYRVDVDCA